MFPELLKTLRTEKGLSQAQLAKEIGVSTGNIGDWEIGRSKPGYSAIASLSRFFGVSSDCLLGLDTVNTVTKEPRFQIYCDGVPLDDEEADLIAMYRLLDDRGREDIFNFVTMKYELATGEKESIYSTYTDEERGRKKRAPGDSGTSSGIA